MDQIRELTRAGFAPLVAGVVPLVVVMELPYVGTTVILTDHGGPAKARSLPETAPARRYFKMRRPSPQCRCYGMKRLKQDLHETAISRPDHSSSAGGTCAV